MTNELKKKTLVELKQIAKENNIKNGTEIILIQYYKMNKKLSKEIKKS